MYKRYFVNILYEKKFIKNDLLNKILDELEIQKEVSFMDILKNNEIEFENIKQVMIDDFNALYIDISNIKINEEVLEIINYDIAIKYNILPLKIENEKLSIIVENPLDLKVIEDIEIITGFNVVVFFTDTSKLKVHINKYYNSKNIESINTNFVFEENIYKNSKSIEKELSNNINDSPVVKLINTVLETAVILKASDIHIEPYESIVRIRFRIDGDLIKYKNLESSILQNIISRIKIISLMDINEKRTPQDGHFEMKINNLLIDFRTSSMPTIFGEKIVIRLIYTHGSILDKEKLGFFEEDIKKINKVLKNQSGAILVTGPTGSGKTTTLSSFLKEINKENINIITIEDPVENIIHGVNQININPKAGLNFSNALRSILRQDPDIMMIGEIRDNETANIAIRAALTGHLVLSTLHTNDSISAITRLLDMGIEYYMIFSSIKCVISQRLVKRLCNKCKTKKKISKNDSIILDISEDTYIYEELGCDNCNNTGYSGRFAVYELIIIDDFIKKVVENNFTTNEIKIAFREKGIKTIWDIALKNVLIGTTSIKEMYRVTNV